MGKSGCAVPYCQPSNDDARHRLPNPKRLPDLFNLWLGVLNNPALKDLDRDAIYKKTRVCNKHFVKEFYCTNNRLRKDAFPQLHLPSKKMTGTCKRFCSVPQCRTYYSKDVSIHLFPKDEKLREKWRIALGIRKPISKFMYVCKKHFAREDFMPSPAGKIKRAILKKGIIPSRNLPQCNQSINISDIVKNQGFEPDEYSEILEYAERNVIDTVKTDSKLSRKKIDGYTAGQEQNTYNLRKIFPPPKNVDKGTSTNKSSKASPKKQLKKNDLDSSKSDTLEMMPVNDLRDGKVPDLFNEPTIEVIYLPEMKEDDGNVQSEDPVTSPERVPLAEPCLDTSSELESILPLGLPPPQDYDPTSDFVPKRMYMELKFNYMDVLSRHRKLEKTAREWEEERKQLRAENYRLIYELRKLKNM